MTDVMLSAQPIAFNHPAEMISAAKMLLLRIYRFSLKGARPTMIEFESVCDAIERLDVLEEQLKENLKTQFRQFECDIDCGVHDDETAGRVLDPVGFLTEFRRNLLDAHVFWFPDKWSQGEQSQELNHAIAEVGKISDRVSEAYLCGLELDAILEEEGDL